MTFIDISYTHTFCFLNIETKQNATLEELLETELLEGENPNNPDGQQIFRA